MRTQHSIAAQLRNRKSLAQRYLQAMLPGILLLSAATLGYGQVQEPSLVPLSQGSGPNTGRQNSAQSASSALGGGGALTDRPIFPGETVHVAVFGAPDFSTDMQVSEEGDIAIPVVGAVHLEGLDSLKAERLIEARLKDLNLILDPYVTVTIDNPGTGITVLGEVRAPGIYQPTGNHTLADLLAAAGGLTANTGRVIQISSDHGPKKAVDLAWDPTMHNTANYSYPVHAGDQVLVRPCGIAYVGGHVAKPGAYSLCGSRTITLSELVALAGGETPFTALRHAYLIRTQPDGTRVARLVDLYRVLRAKEPDPVITEDDIVYISPSPLKRALNEALTWVTAITPALFYIYQP